MSKMLRLTESQLHDRTQKLLRSQAAKNLEPAKEAGLSGETNARKTEAARRRPDRPVPTEHEEQVAFFRWLETEGLFLARYAFAIPNGGVRHIGTARKLKAEGVKAGVPDIFISYPQEPYHGLYIEMKRTKNSSVSKDQKTMAEIFRSVGYCVEVCQGCEEAITAVQNYMGWWE